MYLLRQLARVKISCCSLYVSLQNLYTSYFQTIAYNTKHTLLIKPINTLDHISYVVSTVLFLKDSRLIFLLFRHILQYIQQYSYDSFNITVMLIRYFLMCPNRHSFLFQLQDSKKVSEWKEYSYFRYTYSKNVSQM